jgi:hypothetical protein
MAMMAGCQMAVQQCQSEQRPLLLQARLPPEGALVVVVVMLHRKAA